MLYKYSDFVLTEGAKSRPGVIYWNNQLDDLINKNWYDISVVKEKPGYAIVFRTEGAETDYNYYQVLLSTKGKEEFLMEDPFNKKFVEKLNTEFWKKAPEYVEKMAYEPKFLGDLGHVKDAKRYNL